MMEFKILLENVGNDRNQMFNSILLVIGPILGILFQIVFQNITERKKIRKEEMRERKNIIKNELENFYYPVLELLRKNKIMYKIFKYKKDGNFKTLIELLKEGKLESNDKAILEEIVKIDDDINTLVLRYKHIIKEDNELSIALNNASVHFTLMKMAYDGKLKNDDERFLEYIYPKKLEQNIEEKIKELNKKINDN